MGKVIIYTYHDECSQMELSWEPKHNRFYADTTNPFIESHGPEDALYALAILSQGGELNTDDIIANIIKEHPNAEPYAANIKSALETITQAELYDYLAQF